MRFDGSRPIFLQIVDLISESVLSGRYTDRIPSVREIAAELEVNPNTVARAYMYLQDRGIIRMKRGLGYYVAQDGAELVMNARREDFIRRELPSFFKTMDLLGITLAQLGSHYESYSSGDFENCSAVSQKDELNENVESGDEEMFTE